MTSSKLTAEHIWDFFSLVALLLISQEKEYKGLIIEGRSMVRTYQGLPPYVQKQFEDIANTLNEERTQEDA